ncbi:MAG: hypothetical protein PHR20_02290 [Bacteroidales bacterium]|nr:hypothetical protein [Bacteroidales bacterium]
MKFKQLVLLIIMSGLIIPCFAQDVSQSAIEKREKRKNLTIKEWNTKVGSKVPFLDHVTTYDEFGRKVEEIEYASYGQRSRIVFEYDKDGVEAKCVREIEYDDRDRISRIRKFEFYEDGSEKRQYNYFPNGKLESYKEYEYSFR